MREVGHEPAVAVEPATESEDLPAVEAAYQKARNILLGPFCEFSEIGPVDDADRFHHRVGGVEGEALLIDNVGVYLARQVSDGFIDVAYLGRRRRREIVAECFVDRGAVNDLGVLIGGGADDLRGFARFVRRQAGQMRW